MTAILVQEEYGGAEGVDAALERYLAQELSLVEAIEIQGEDFLTFDLLLTCGVHLQLSEEFGLDVTIYEQTHCCAGDGIWTPREEAYLCSKCQAKVPTLFRSLCNQHTMEQGCQDELAPGLEAMLSRLYPPLEAQLGASELADFAQWVWKTFYRS